MASDWTWWLRVVKSIIILSLDHTTWWIEQINSAVKDLQLDIKKWIPPQLCLSKWIPKSRGLTAIEIIPSLIFYDPSQRCLIGGIRLFEGHIHWIYWIWLIHLDKVITEMADAVSFQPREFPVGSQDSIHTSTTSTSSWGLLRPGTGRNSTLPVTTGKWWQASGCVEWILTNHIRAIWASVPIAGLNLKICLFVAVQLPRLEIVALKASKSIQIQARSIELHIRHGNKAGV